MPSHHMHPYRWRDAFSRNTCPTFFSSISKVESEYELAERAKLRKQAARDRNDSRLMASAGLAEHLLQGWAMLSKACPRPGCHSPLMRDKNGTEVCIACSKPDPECEDDQSRVQTAGDVMGEKFTEEEAEEDRDMVDDGVGREYANLRMAELAYNRAIGRTVSASATDGQDAVYYGCVKERTLDTLYRALDVSQQRLSVCGERIPVDVDESGRQADLIAKLAFAARAVFDLPTGERRK